RHLVPAILSEKEWKSLESEVERDVASGLTAARARPSPDPSTVKRFVYAEEDVQAAPALGGLSREEREKLGGTDVPESGGAVVRLAEAVRLTLRRELEVN